ncbi:MAG: hypothetical protein HYY16_02275 [Planctomycetes bacterium]|nr:hypothetical protein [Planctomycetota bacterium]
MTTIPEVKALLIADAVIQDKTTNKWSVIGVFDRVAAPAFPTARPTLAIYVKLADVRGTLKVAVEFRDAADRMLNRLEGIEITVPTAVTTVDFGLQTYNLPIPVPGKYHFVLYINGELAQMVPVEAVVLEAPKRPPQEAV